MPIARITVELEIPHAQSLKDRRQALRSMKDKLRHSFNVSVAEMDEGLVWNRATLHLAAISNSTSYLRGQCEAIERALHGHANQLSVQITDLYAEILYAEGPENDGPDNDGPDTVVPDEPDE